MPLNLLPVRYKLGYIDGSDYSYSNITVIGIYNYPVYTGDLVSSYGNFYSTLPQGVDRRVELAAEFSTVPWADVGVPISTDLTISHSYSPIMERNNIVCSRFSQNYTYQLYTMEFIGDDKVYVFDTVNKIHKCYLNNTLIFSVGINNISTPYPTIIFPHYNWRLNPVSNNYNNTNLLCPFFVINNSTVYYSYLILATWGANADSFALTYASYSYSAELSGDYQVYADTINNVVSGRNISTFTAVLNNYNWRYTGEFITPTLTITDPTTQTVLVEGTDYTKTYTNNLNPGTANVLAAGIGNYTGSKSINFYIIAKDITESVSCSLNKYAWEYTGEFITPDVQVWDTLEEVQLTNLVDYQYTYINNLNVGTASVIIVGIGDWTGTVTLDFQIVSGDDPYNPDDPSGGGGGSGDQDLTSDPVDFPTLPGLSAVSTGFCSIYVPTTAQLNAIASYMWSTDWTDILNKLVANPIDTILGLSIVPCTVPYRTGTFVIGNYQTSLSINIANNQYVIVDCGTLTLDEFWGSYLDYSPYTKVDIFLPFIGIRQLNPDDIRGKVMNLKYYIDIVTGQCMAIIKVADHVLYSFAGSCAITLPITSNNYGQVLISAAVDIVKSGSVALASGSPGATASGLESAVNMSKDMIERSGSFSGHSGFLGNRTPYLIVTQPRACIPSMQNKFTGYPSYVTVRLDQLTGFTKVSDIHLDTLPATKDEMDELHEILTTGFIIQ